MAIQVDIGTDDAGRSASIDLEELLATRLLVQGNSGSGKSHLLRRLLERSAEHVQQVIIDPEGDFVTLAEVYGHVVVEGSDYSVTEVGKFAARCREHRASVVLSLEGLEAEGQMRCAAAFLSGMFDAPREHWYPALVVVDEAQVFAPSGAVEVIEEVRRASLSAMTNLDVPWPQTRACRNHRDAAPREARQERRRRSVELPDGADLPRYRHGARRSARHGAASGRYDLRSPARPLPRAWSGHFTPAGFDPDRLCPDRPRAAPARC